MSGSKADHPSSSAVPFKNLLTRDIYPLAFEMDRKAIGVSMNTSIVLIHLGRCGSTVLANLLNQHSQITWHGEILEPMLQRARMSHGEFFRLDGDPVALALRALNRGQTPYAGVEVKPFHFTAFGTSPAPFIDHIREAGPHRFIVLDRRNRLRKIVSNRLAFRTGVWHVPAGATRDKQSLNLSTENLEFELKRGSLKEFLQLYDLQFEEVRQLLSPDYLDLIYEEHIREDPMKAYREVVNYLDLQEEPVTVEHGRTNAAPLSEVLENFDEVSAHLTGTKYAWMLDG